MAKPGVRIRAAIWRGVALSVALAPPVYLLVPPAASSLTPLASDASA
jgi:hypothetical protein